MAIVFSALQLGNSKDFLATAQLFPPVIFGVSREVFKYAAWNWDWAVFQNGGRFSWSIKQLLKNRREMGVFVEKDVEIKDTGQQNWR